MNYHVIIVKLDIGYNIELKWFGSANTKMTAEKILIMAKNATEIANSNKQYSGHEYDYKIVEIPSWETAN